MTNKEDKQEGEKITKKIMKEYPICPRCFNKSVAGAHMTSNNKRSMYCTSGSCNYDMPFEQLTTPVRFKHINKGIQKIISYLLSL